MDNRNLGPLMISVNGLELTCEEKEMLDHPAVGGVILFARNYVSLEQITYLNQQIKDLKNKNKKSGNQLLLSIDHEGGSVQRIKEPLTVIPSMSSIGKLYEYDSTAAINVAKNIGWLLAAELATLGFDFSFTPVVDLNLCNNKIIKTRAFHKKPMVVATLSVALQEGLNSAGMVAVAKHYPGHGGVIDDSHFVTPVDERAYKEIDHLDLEPYRVLIRNGLAAIMTSHILYTNIDNNVATFSKFWLQDILREKLGFKGLVISDDLNMTGAKIFMLEANSLQNIPYIEAVNNSLAAGCELLLLCNNEKGVVQLLDNWSQVKWQNTDRYQEKLNNMRLKGKGNCISLQELKKQTLWSKALSSLDLLDKPKSGKKEKV